MICLFPPLESAPAAISRVRPFDCPHLYIRFIMAPATVLLIDNDSDSIAIYSMILKHHGYQVIHALDGETGLRLAVETRPDLVISELYMPRVGGGESVLDRLQRDERTAKTPVIVLDSIPSFGWKLLDDHGGLNRLTKPCEPSRLLQEVERVLDPQVPIPR